MTMNAKGRTGRKAVSKGQADRQADRQIQPRQTRTSEQTDTARYAGRRTSTPSAAWLGLHRPAARLHTSPAPVRTFHRLKAAAKRSRADREALRRPSYDASIAGGTGTAKQLARSWHWKPCRQRSPQGCDASIVGDTATAEQLQTSPAQPDSPRWKATAANENAGTATATQPQTSPAQLQLTRWQPQPQQRSRPAQPCAATQYTRPP